MDTLNIGVIIGSTRDGRFSEYPASWIIAQGKEHTALTLNAIDLRDFTLPFLTDRKNPSQKNGIYDDAPVAAFEKKITEQDGYIIITPEYNHGYSAVLKNAIDHIYGEWVKKPVGFIAYGSVGGARAVEQLRLVAIEHQMAPIRNSVHIMAPWFLRNEDGSLKENALQEYGRQANTMLTELTWWARTLKTPRSAA